MRCDASSCRYPCFLLLAGCATNSVIVATGKDSFLISKKAATGLLGMGTLKQIRPRTLPYSSQRAADTGFNFSRELRPSQWRVRM
jgi:hypothetical protein